MDLSKLNPLEIVEAYIKAKGEIKKGEAL